jgi:endoglucanase
MRKALRFMTGFWMLVAGAGPAAAATIDLADWQSYRDRFIDGSGRVIDDANDNISHSEGQGYGLLLAFLADRPADFEQIWSFTRTELLIRDDGLAAWTWNPTATPRITDINNATDGDILIAYALSEAGAAWKRDDYMDAARKIAQAVLDKAVIAHDGETQLLPGVDGFSAKDRPDGPVVNPSYCVFEAFPALNKVVPSEKWQALSDGCHSLLKHARFGPKKLPAEWVSLAGTPKPADGFAPEFAYNALRIPLYLLRGGIEDRALLADLRSGMSDAAGSITIVDLPTGDIKKVLDDPGYQSINHLVACVLDGTPLPALARRFLPTVYYPSTLHLLVLAYIAAKRPECR